MSLTLTDAQGRAVQLLETHGILPGSWMFHRDLVALPADAQRAMAILTDAGLVERFGFSARLKAVAEPAYQQWLAGVFAEGDLKTK